MSGIAGIYHRNGQAVEPALLQRMMEAVAYRTLDGQDFWREGNIGFGHGKVGTTAEALHERQPLQDATGRYCLTLDGRLDNQEELRRELAARSLRLRDASDAELVLQSYLCWGEECPVHLLGDFAFALWDSQEQRLFCARDIIGLRPFTYFYDGKTFLFASEVSQLLALPIVPREPNEGMIVEVLADWTTSKEETLYRNIYRLPPAHCLTLHNGEIRVRSYWQPNPRAEIRSKSDAEYADNFLALFREAVRCRLPSHRTVGLDLSGGLDSSSIVLMAQELQQAGLADNPGMETFSQVFPGLPCDESAFIEMVRAKVSFPSHSYPLDRPDLTWYRENTRLTGELPDYPNGSVSTQYSALLQERGVRVALSGVGGDQWLSGGECYYADYLYRGQFRSLASQVGQDWRRSGGKYALSQLWSYGLRPFLPRGAVEFLRKVRPFPIPAWLSADFAQRNHLLERVWADEKTRYFPLPTRQEIFSSNTSGRQIYSYETDMRQTARLGLEVRQPFQDRRIIEYTMALPHEQFYQNRTMKWMLRQAMQGRLPEPIRLRSDKAEFSHLFIHATQSLMEEVLPVPHLQALGWVHPEVVQRMYQEMHQCYQENGWGMHTWRLWHILSVELWYRENIARA